MKYTLTFVLVVLGILLLWTYRRRVGFAFKVGSFAYIVLLAINIVRYSGDEESFNSFLVLFAGAAIIWGLAWLLVTSIERRRQGGGKR